LTLLETRGGSLTDDREGLVMEVQRILSYDICTVDERARSLILLASINHRCFPRLLSINPRPHQQAPQVDGIAQALLFQVLQDR